MTEFKIKNLKLKILIIIPPFITLPAKGHGGTERIAEGMIDELLRRGHEVTLLGAGKCHTNAKYVAIFPKTISEQKFDSVYVEQSRPLRVETAYITKVMKYLLDHDGEFDIVFNHLRGGYLMLPLAQFLKTPIISTMHLPIFAEVAEVLRLFKKPNVVTISDSQRKPAPDVNYLATIYNGLDLGEFSFNPKPKDYFLFMGAIGEHKSPHLAIEACKKTGVKLILAGGKKREPYFSQRIAPQIDNKQITFVGEVNGKKRVELFRNARGFLFPITWEEPFGLVVIEAMACGTPVIAFDHGAMREIIESGKTGFIVKDVQGMVRAIKKIDQTDRRACRKAVEEHFTYQKMVDGYLAAVNKILNPK